MLTDNISKPSCTLLSVTKYKIPALKSVLSFLCKYSLAPPPLAVISTLLIFMFDEFSIKIAAVLPFEFIIGRLEFPSIS